MRALKSKNCNNNFYSSFKVEEDFRKNDLHQNMTKNCTNFINISHLEKYLKEHQIFVWVEYDTKM